MYTLSETERIALVAENTYNPVVIADKDRSIVWVNPAFTALTGYTLEEVVGKKPSILHCENTNRQTVDEIREKLERKEKVEAELINKNKFGREYWIRISVTPVSVGDRFVGYISVENEITKEIELIKSLKESELKYKAIFNSSNDRYVFVDKNYELKAFNNSSKTHIKNNLGIDIEEGDDFRKVLVTKDIQRLFYHSFDLAIAGKEFYFEEQVELKDGQKPWYSFKGSPVYDVDGQIIGGGFTWSEYSKEKHLAVLLEESEVKYKAIMDSTEDRHVLIGLDNKLLAFNKSALKNLKLTIGEDLIEGQNFVEYLKGHEHVFDLHKGIEKAKNNQFHLYEHAVNTDEGARWLRINYMPVYNNVTQLIGISINWSDITAQKEAEQKVLNQLKQLKEFSYITSHKLRQPLANIIGITQLISTSGNTDELPGLIAQLKNTASDLDDIINAMSQSVATAGFEQKPPVNTAIKKDEPPKHIYIVDDDPVNNMITRKLLSRTIAGVAVDEFLEGQHAITKLKEGVLPDLIILDINMHPLDGWGFLNEFEKLGIHVPIVMCSSSVDPDDLRRAQSNPLINSFLSKPITKELINELYNIA